MMPTIYSNISVDFTQTFIALAYFGLALSSSNFEETMWIRSQTHKLKLPLLFHNQIMTSFVMI